jgi:hypothetical protein
MSIQISKNGRLFGILAGLGGAAMIGSAALPWKQAVLITAAYEGYDISLQGGAAGEPRWCWGSPRSPAQRPLSEPTQYGS